MASGSSGSTWEANGLLPGGGVSEGEIYLGFPPKPDADRYPVPTCTNARVKVISTDDGDRSQEVVVYPVDSSIIDAAINAQIGRTVAPAASRRLTLRRSDRRETAQVVARAASR